MAGARKKTASKKAKDRVPRKPNTTTAPRTGRKAVGKGTRSQSNKQKKAGLETGARQLSGNSGKEKSPLKEK